MLSVQHRYKLTWMDAAGECAKTGSHLVYIDSSNEDRFVVNNLKPLVDESNGRDYLTSVWTGGADDQVEGSWVWYGNDQPILEYTNWYPGQPDSGSGDHDEDCICLVGNHGYLWQDHKCTEKMYWVCEMTDSATAVVG
ncbi:perlucin-like [Mercenaria mercenaria]|uniref:perlucin-like n=1 Tax=Mercenaria mercenaria TaxID=6596 RepID=UPI00234EBACF|nr:perlucin-like [Mercenaria mercenaria]